MDKDLWKEDPDPWQDRLQDQEVGHEGKYWHLHTRILYFDKVWVHSVARGSTWSAQSSCLTNIHQACKKSAKCTGVNKAASKKYYTATGRVAKHLVVVYRLSYPLFLLELSSYPIIALIRSLQEVILSLLMGSSVGTKVVVTLLTSPTTKLSGEPLILVNNCQNLYRHASIINFNNSCNRIWTFFL